MTEEMGPVAIIGTGLIGGSLGLRLRAVDPQLQVKGYDVREDVRAAAAAAGAVTATGTTPSDTVAGARIVVLSVPTDRVVDVARQIAPGLGPRAVVTDVGSAKAEIVGAISSICPRFVGGHPMAGSERAGIEAARADLFEDATWILTPDHATDQEAYRSVRALVGLTGARPIAVTPKDHDALVARLSHVPQLVASSLVNLAASAGNETALLGVAAGGFRDVTRIAASNPDLWVAILRANRRSVLEALAGMSSWVGQIGEALEAEDWGSVRAFLERARSARLQLFQKPETAGEPHHLVLLIPDRPGVLAEVTTAAGHIGANIEDLRIFHSPEGGRGRLELVIAGLPATQRLAGRLEGLGYSVTTDPVAL